MSKLLSVKVHMVRIGGQRHYHLEPVFDKEPRGGWKFPGTLSGVYRGETGKQFVEKLAGRVNSKLDPFAQARHRFYIVVNLWTQKLTAPFATKVAAEKEARMQRKRADMFLEVSTNVGVIEYATFKKREAEFEDFTRVATTDPLRDRPEKARKK